MHGFAAYSVQYLVIFGSSYNWFVRSLKCQLDLPGILVVLSCCMSAGLLFLLLSNACIVSQL